MATAIEQTLQDINEQLILILPIKEGLEDYRRLNLETEAKAVVTTQMTVYNDRIKLLNDAKAALEALIADGYPDLNVEETSPAVMEELQANIDTISAAFATFTAEQAARLGLSSSAPQPK